MRAIVGVLLLLSLVAISSQSCHNPGWTSIGGSGGGGGNGGGGGAAQTVEAQTVEAQTVEAQRGEAQTVEADFSAVSTELLEDRQLPVLDEQRVSLVLPISVRTVLEACTLSPPRRVLNLAW